MHRASTPILVASIFVATIVAVRYAPQAQAVTASSGQSSATRSASATQTELPPDADIATFLGWLERTPIVGQTGKRVWREQDTVRGISLSGLSITPQELKLSSQVATITDLWADSTEAPSDLHPLASLPHLQHLWLMNSHLKPDCFAWVTADMPLRALHLNSASGVTGNLKPLARLKNLRLLNLLGTDVIDSDVHDLTAFPVLDNLTLSATHCTDHAVEDIIQIKSLHTLWLGNSGIISDVALNRLRKFRRDLIIMN